MASTFNLINTNKPDGVVLTKFYDDELNVFLEEKNLTFSGGAASTSLDVVGGSSVHSLDKGNNPPVTGMCYVGTTVAIINDDSAFTAQPQVDTVWMLGASIFDAIVAGRNNLMSKQIALNGVVDISVDDQSTGGRHIDEILAHWETVKSSITGQDNVIVACHIVANDAIGYHPWSTMTQTTRDSLIADAETLLASIISNGNIPLIFNNTFIDFDDDTYLDESKGVLPFNENINYVQSQLMPLYQWNESKGMPACGLYNHSFNINHLESTDNIHWTETGSELLRRIVTKQLAQFILGEQPITFDKLSNPRAKDFVPQDILIVPISNTASIPSTQSPNMMYWEFNDTTVSARTVPVSGYEPCSLTIDSAGITGWSYTTDPTQSDDGDYSPTLANYLVRKNRLTTSNANTYQPFFTIKGGVANAPFELDVACYELTNSQSNYAAFSLDGLTDEVVINSGSNTSGLDSAVDNIGTIAGSFDASGEFTLYGRRRSGSYACAFNGCYLRLL
jgi:hypothetical protein